MTSVIYKKKSVLSDSRYWDRRKKLGLNGYVKVATTIPTMAHCVF